MCAATPSLTCCAHQPDPVGPSVAPPAQIIVQPIDAACVFEAKAPPGLDTHAVHQPTGGYLVPDDEWAAVGKRDVAWRRVWDEVQTCKKQVEILKTHLP